MNNKAINKVNDTFLKIAKEKEDNINTKSLRKNVTARALGAGLTGALIGAEARIGASMGSGNMSTAKKYGKAGAAIGAGLLAANSIRKNVKHNRKIDAIDERLNKSAFDIVNESFEKIAGRMPFTLPNGEYATPHGFNPSWDEIDEEYREEIPSNFKVVGQSPSGEYFLVDTDSDKNDPLMYEYFPGGDFYEVDTNYRDSLYTPAALKNKNFHKLKQKGMNDYKSIDGLKEHQLKELGYSKPTLKDTVKSVGRMAKKSLGTIGMPALLGAGMGASSPFENTLKSSAKSALVGAGIGAIAGAGLNHSAGGFKLDDTAKIRQEKLKKELKDDIITDEINQDFLKQYKTASEIVNSAFDKLAK